ncbi:hypothetical protein J437_LFUL014648 [Ladona fulva]|uniref:Endonuclease/exonuclease/phosphatase domain-containing protein n=1 Tax=Ladona fulva TaxID=123851 RepID=A0A8K0KJW1_LADFU|nr:hypothetical protein J437_LFUL014648 [Ladona fulva]
MARVRLSQWCSVRREESFVVFILWREYQTRGREERVAKISDLNSDDEGDLSGRGVCRLRNIQSSDYDKNVADGVDTRASSEEETSRRGNERRITSRTKGFIGNIIKIKSENRRDGVKEGGGEEEGGEEGVRRESGVNMVKEVEMDKRSGDIIFEADAAGGETLGRNGFLRFLQVNCRSLVKKVVEFQSLIEIHEPDVIICTETWLREEISDSEIFTCNYHTFRRDRFTKGGVCICVNKELQSSV